MPKPIHRLATVGQIAERLGASIHQVEYVIRSRGIQPMGRAGNHRVFSEDSVKLISEAIERIELRKEALK